MAILALTTWPRRSSALLLLHQHGAGLIVFRLYELLDLWRVGRIRPTLFGHPPRRDKALGWHCC